MKYIYLLLVGLSLCSSTLSAQSLPPTYHLDEDEGTIVRRQTTNSTLYARDTVRTIAIRFADPEWWDNVQDSTILGTVVFDGDTLLDVGVRVKGSSSDFANNTLKKSFDLSFDFIHEGQEIDGYDATNLHGGIFDPSHVREVLFYEIGGNYLPVAKSNYVHVTINDQNWGVYVNTQQLDRSFLKEWFSDDPGPRWRGESPFRRIGPDLTCEDPEDFYGRRATPSGLHYLGLDSAAYWPYYTAKGEQVSGDWDKLVRFIDRLNNIPDEELLDSLPNYLDVDGALWFLAHEIILGDEDGYVFKTQSDYYLYHEPMTGQMVPLEYDGNSCIEGRSISWEPFHRAEDPCIPLVNRLLNNPELQQRYLAHVRTILDHFYTTDVVLPRIAFYADLIDEFEQDDPIGDSLYVYSQFQSGLTSLSNIVNQRLSFLNSHPDIIRPNLELSELSHAPYQSAQSEVRSTDSVVVTVRVENGADAIGTLYYALGQFGKFAEAALRDNGSGVDLLAGDGVFSGTIPPQSAESFIRYYVKMVANDGFQTVSFLPEGATHDVQYYLVAPDEDLTTPISINEVMASNSSTAFDEFGESDDWVELYNRGRLPLDLQGYYLSDELEALDKWRIDSSIVIQPGGYQIFWADKDDEQGYTHTNFKLSKGGESVYLVNPNGELVDKVTYDDQTTDISWARTEDGTGDFDFMTPTFGSANSPLSGNPIDTANSTLGDSIKVIQVDTSTVNTTKDVNLERSVLLYPNPNQIGLNTHLQFNSLSNSSTQIRLFDATGRKFWEVVEPSIKEVGAILELPTSSLNPGLYTIVLTRDSEIVVKRLSMQ